jgi:phosphoserine phosphatase RsbU/P
VRASGAHDTELLEAAPPAVGFFPEAEFEESTLTLKPRDRLYLYTDGLFEICNADAEEFGEERLATVFRSASELSLADSIQAVLQQTRSWRGEEAALDDVSILALELT